MYSLTVSYFLGRPGLSDFVDPFSERIERKLAQSLRKTDFAHHLPPLEVQPISIRVSVDPVTEDQLTLYRKKNSRIIEPTICCNFVFFYDQNIVSESIKSHKKERKLSQSQSALAISNLYATLSNSYANRLIMLINIAAPGFCDAWDCVTNVPTWFEDMGESIRNNLDEVYFEDQYLKESRFPYVEPSRIVAWSKSMKGFWAGLPETNVERALCYFSYLFAGHRAVDHHHTAIWAYGALEAIFSDTTTGILEKLRKRLSGVMKQSGLPDNSKAISRLYNDRSRVLHGQVSFAANYADPYDTEQGGMYYRGVYSSLPTALLVLITTLRFACKRNARSITFKESILLS